MQNLKLRIRRVVGSKVKLMKICWEIAAIVNGKTCKAEWKNFNFNLCKKGKHGIIRDYQKCRIATRYIISLFQFIFDHSQSINLNAKFIFGQLLLCCGFTSLMNLPPTTFPWQWSLIWCGSCHYVYIYHYHRHHWHVFDLSTVDQLQISQVKHLIFMRLFFFLLPTSNLPEQLSQWQTS